jgi:hypothetical protein
MVQTLFQKKFGPFGIMFVQGVSPHPSSQAAIDKEALIQLSNLQTMYPSTKSFFDYVDAYWVPKISMWCIGARNIPHVNQDTNVAIEAYHGNFKEQLKSMKCRLEGRKLYLLIH